MGANSKISWTDDTFNPWIGCTKISPGCQNCYAERDFDHRFQKAKWGPHSARVKTSPGNWEKPLFWNAQAGRVGRRRFVFCASLSDVFEEPQHKMFDQWGDQVCISEARKQLFELIDRTPNLVWLLLTKRPENIRACWIGGIRQNVMLGTSIENQKAADDRLNLLCDLRDLSPNFFISAEPLLEHVNLSDDFLGRGVLGRMPGLVRWVIVGGESGPAAREIKTEWIESIRQQCLQSDVDFFFKQWGANPYGFAPDSDFFNGQQFHQRPEVCLPIAGRIKWFED